MSACENHAQCCCESGTEINCLQEAGPSGTRRFHLQTGGAGEDRARIICEPAGRAYLEGAQPLFNGLYALALEEVAQNSVDLIANGDYREGAPFSLKAFQTGEMWSFVWTRDLAYAVDLGLAGLDPERCLESLLFKTSEPKPGVVATGPQILQDTGSGGSYPVSTDRVVWALGFRRLLPQLAPEERRRVIERVYPILAATVTQDRALVFDPADGLYRGEQSFLDWREQTYPAGTARDVLPIALSKALSTNVLHYVILNLAAELAPAGDSARYAAWAGELKAAINRGFYDAEAGLYATYLYTDLLYPLRVRRYDLLGNSLAILTGIADPGQARSCLARYPTGPHGPPVVWPQEQGTHIYHNHAIWPFVTAYWALAGRAAGNARVVDQATHSLVRGAALNLSNMENLDWASGRRYAEIPGMSGPPINSPRQLWSVAAYVALVHGVIFGMEFGADSVSFRPFITAESRKCHLGEGAPVSLRGVEWRGKRLDVTLIFPREPGRCRLRALSLNGAPHPGPIRWEDLAAANQVDLHLEIDPEDVPGDLVMADPGQPHTYFAPRPPEWVGEGIRHEDGRVQLSFASADAGNVTYRVYRDGELAAEGLREGRWADSAPGHYQVVAVDIETGLSSYPTPTLYGAPIQEMPPDATLRPAESGEYLLRFRYANGAGPINTGLGCGVKRLEVRDAATGELAAGFYVILPQTGGSGIFLWSSPVRLALEAGREYALRLVENEFTVNMTYFQRNADYTANPGGGTEPHNEVTLEAVQLLPLSAQYK
jgi:hypothetical protein